MNWAPALAASWARSSCFWIIDSLSPVQLAWTSAPRMVRAMSRVTSLGYRMVEEARGYTATARAAPGGLTRPGWPPAVFACTTR